MKKIVFFGGSSLLAVNWASRIAHNYTVYLIMHKRMIDLPNVNCVSFEDKFETSLFSFLNEIQPDYIVNCAALTNVDQCEIEVEKAKEVNQLWPKKLAQISLETGSKLIHISTDHLYDGAKKIYAEDDLVSPLNVYGKTKAQAEDEVLSINPKTLVVRTNFYGWGLSYRKSFSDFILNGLRSSIQLNLFNDVFYTPIYMGELIRLLHLALKKKLSGIYNFVGNECMSKFEFGVALANAFSHPVELITAVSISSKENLVDRPKNMSLSNQKLTQALGIKILSLEEQIKLMINEEPKEVLI